MAKEAEALSQQAERIKQLREAKRVTQPIVADAVGVSLRGYQDWEGARSDPNVENLRALAAYFEVSAGYIEYGADRARNGATPEPFSGADELAQLHRIEARLASIEKLLTVFTGADSDAAGADLADQLTVEQAANILRNSTRLMERVAARLGQNIGKRDLESRRAMDPPGATPEVAA